MRYKRTHAKLARQLEKKFARRRKRSKRGRDRVSKSKLCLTFVDNINREVFALLGDQDPQMVPAEESGDEKEKKKRPVLNRHVDKWAMQAFTNPARSDGTTLNHWVKVKEKNEVYPFARFDRKPQVVKYTDEEYSSVVKPLSDAHGQGSDWSKDETDCLFDLCERFNINFIVIADRFSTEFQDRLALQPKPTRKRDKKAASKVNFQAPPKDRTVDELKDRYYSVSRALLQSRKDTKNPIVSVPFNYEQEVRRKYNLEKVFMRTKEQHEKEKHMVAGLKKIEQKIKKEEKEERNLAKLIAHDWEDAKLPPEYEKVDKPSKKDKAPSGVFLLSSRF